MTSNTTEELQDQRRGVDDWCTYDEFAHGINTYRLPSRSLDGRTLTLEIEGGGRLELKFGAETVYWNSDGLLDSEQGNEDPYDAVPVRENVWFINLPLVSRDREAITLVLSEKTGQGILVHSVIGAEKVDGEPQVTQTFSAAALLGTERAGQVPAPSRDLIGMRNLYRYSPDHLYEHIYISSERYAWQNLEGVQRGHGDMDLSTVWKLDDGLYLFCFREFRISVASVWLHDLGYQLMTTGMFLGINGEGNSEHSTAGGHIYPLGSVKYPDAQPV